MKLDLNDTFVVVRDTIPPKFARSKNRVLQAGKIVKVVHIYSEYYVQLKEVDTKYKFELDPKRDSYFVNWCLKRIEPIITKEDQRLARILFSR